MRAAVTGLLGALPSPQFQVTLRAPHDQLESLLLSMMCTGYCLRNAEFEAELEKKWEAASASQAPRLAEEERAALSPETAAYIKFLEARPQSIETSTRGASQLLLAVSREPCIKDVAQLTKVAGDCIPEAFHAVANKIIVRLKVSQAGSPRMTFMDHVMTGCCQFTSDHGLPQLDIGTSICFGRERMMEVLMWCLLVGYYAKDVEYRTTLERCMFRGKEVPKVVEQEKLPSGRAWLDRLSGFFTQGL
ncbi:unnamed protein product [Ostreobium quekettii]|uniref:Uncharacterized protein n=1 Tax=Ostreobium quekettii TaxID=121088 RepID=A0A8S1IW01_9CHLO|nr:unnamed protein product [Ostreobium quekettii]